MTTMTITVVKPVGGFDNLHNAIRSIPMNLVHESGAYPDGDNMNVEIRAKRKNDAYDAATIFINSFDGLVLAAIEKTGKKESAFQL